MREIAITATARDKSGKGSARRSRREGMIPAIVYGPEIDPLSLSINEREFRTAMKQASRGSIINLEVGGNTNKVLIRELQRDPVTSRVIHVDFHAISMNKPIHVSIPIHFVGTAKGVKTEGGIMQITMREAEISCLPADIPDFVEVDVSELGIGDAVHVSNLAIPNAKILAEGQRTVVVISAPTVVKSEAVTAEAAVVAEGEEAAAEAEGAEGAEKEEKKDEKEEKPERAEKGKK
jgi:large subunit ribosomal protein L25